MKNSLLFLCTFALAIVSCDKNDGKLALNDKVVITGVESYSGTKAAADNAGGIMGTGITDSVEFIAKYAESFNCMTLDGKSAWGAASFGMTEENYRNRRDTVLNKLLFEGAHVINSRGELGSFIVNCKDAVFYVYVDENRNALFPLLLGGDPRWDPGRFDTIAYMPNAVLNKARGEITAAFNRKDYAACYRLFDEAYVFVPTTGEKWRAMKAAGIE